MECTKSVCQKCRECCKFEKDEIYFAPLFTKGEIDQLRGINHKKKNFYLYKKSKDVFQVKLKKSKNSKNIYVCPFLDEKSHLCSIYNKRPFDCRIWPFIFMKEKSGIKTTLACFDKDMCQVLDKMNRTEFTLFKQKLYKWLDDENILHFIKKHPLMVWSYEKDTFLIKNI